MSASIPTITRKDRIAGVILGTAVGDALGLPREGLSPRRASRLFGTGRLRHQLVFGRGMVSDDTEHTCMVGQSLLASSGDAEKFDRQLAFRLRWWILGFPAGVGSATARAITKLWCGFPPSRSGIRSAGNGPAMRAALLGICLSDDLDVMQRCVHLSTRLTHTDPRANTGAQLVALAAAHVSDLQDQEKFFDRARAIVAAEDHELQNLLASMRDCLSRRAPAREFAESLGLHRGVSGYIYHTVPVALYCWLESDGHFRPALESAINLGGDTDTVGAIVGALCGATVGDRGIPEEWLRGLGDWPLSERWMRELASRLGNRFGDRDSSEPALPVPFFWPGQLLRNLVFLNVVLFHGFRRLFPPY
jgi:ADP-ribosyl-[dinitrogen reductase] hydrolase